MEKENNTIVPVDEELNVIKLETENIRNLIYTIRGKQVILDSDVARLYHCETKYINRVVKRNEERFPEEFCFQLTENEFQVLRCQFVTLNNNGRRSRMFKVAICDLKQNKQRTTSKVFAICIYRTRNSNAFSITKKDVILVEKENNNIVPINEKVNVVECETKNIKSLIYTIRGKQVMLDSDVAILYQYETKKINQAVKRNIERFPEKFCFQLTEKELEKMWSQIVTTSRLEDNKYRSKKYLPYVFTEQGIAMLSGLLKNEIAVKVSISIMDAFIEMRKFIANNGQVFQEINTIKTKILEHDKRFDEVFDELQKDKQAEFNQKIFFDGQIYDAYSLIIDIIKSAKNKIVMIDNYIDDTILKMLAKKNKEVEVVILTSQNCDISKLDISKFNKQYPVLKIARTNKFHDRFIVIDNKELYHCGASLKDLGKKCFAISKIVDMEYIEKIRKNY